LTLWPLTSNPEKAAVLDFLVSQLTPLLGPDLTPFLRPVLTIVLMLVGAVLLITFMLIGAIFSVWLERKVAGRIQDRLGPTRVGGKFGWLQTLADGMKLLIKEDIIPGPADQFLFRVGPYIALVGAYLAFLVLPFGNGVVAQEMNIAVFFMLAVMSSEIFGVILGAYGSGSKWALFGGMREAAQVVSYEVPRAICILVPIIVAGTLNLSRACQMQEGFLCNWYLFHDPFTFAAFWTFFTCATAGCKRAPFDLAEAESELVAGFHTEYSGFRWLIFFMAEYGAMVAASGIAILYFLGGWHSGFVPWELSTLIGNRLGAPGETGYFLGFWLGNLINVAVFVTKCFLLVFVMMWVRWTLPRLRIDQVMMTCLKYLLPISCVLLLGVSLWQVAVPETVTRVFQYVSAGACVLAAVWMMFKVITTPHTLPFRGVPEDWWKTIPRRPETASKA
jgi:NADH-quinone oxidoreductase subunit H